MNNWSCNWPAPAKLNLMLKVINRRPDGFHEIQTVFQLVDFYDFINFRKRVDSKISIIETIAGVPAGENLCFKAASLLKQESGTKFGVEISLKKALPKGAGLGGGSSDAATTLVALNHIWGCELDHKELLRLGAILGSDVPFFINGLAAWAEGRGEKLEKISLPELWYLIVIPDCEVNTSVIFNDPELTRDSSRITIRAFFDGDVDNDCLSVVLKHHHKVAVALEELSKHADARLTGTGSCIFSEFRSEQEAEKVLRLLPKGMRGIVAKGLNQSPLIGRLAEELGQLT
tara:strand:+ start:1396 stop:2259 length:864 start_codon:yes stop_codon:yes gene_type:complete